MIIQLKNADFSDNNIGKIYIPGINMNIKEGTSSPLLFKNNNETGSGEFLGVSFVTKENPSPFSIIRKLHKGGTGTYLYSFLTSERITIDIPIQPSKLSMAVWINMTKWAEFTQTGGVTFNLQVYSNGWKNNINDGGVNNPIRPTYNYLMSSSTENISSFSGTYYSVDVKSKVLDTQEINGETWKCFGIVFYNIQLNTSEYEENCRLRISTSWSFMNSTSIDMEVANFQVVETDEYLNPTKQY